MLRTKLTMSALTREQVFGGQPYFEAPIPSQWSNAEKAEVTDKVV